MADMSAISIAINGVDNLSGPVGSASRSLTSLQGAATGITTSLGNMAVAAGKAALAVGAIGVAAVGAGFAAATSQAASFEKQISAIGAVSGKTGAELKEISDLALQLGAATSFSASEAAQGIEELVKAGVSMQDIMSGGAKASLDLAAAGAISVGEAAEIASNAMNIFNKSGSEMGHVADVIAGTANASAMDVNQFKLAMAASGAVAASVGIEFEDLAAAFGVMSNAGLKGSDMGTSLKTMMLNLSPSTKPAISAMKELGIITADGANQFFTAEGKAKSLAEIAGVLKTATAGLTAEQRLNALQTMFGTDAIRVAAVMADKGADAFNNMADATKSVGAADVAAARLDNLAGSIEKFKGSAETASIIFGLKFTPILKRGVDIATEALNKALPSIEKFAEQMAGGLDRAIDTAMKAGPTFLAFGRYLALAATEGETMSDWLTELPADLVAPTKMLGGFVAAVRSVTLSIVDLVKGVASGGTGGIMNTLTVGVYQLQSAFKTLLPIVQTIGGAIVTNVIETFRFFTGTVLPPVISIIQQTATLVTGTLMPAFAQTGAVLRGIFGETLAWLAQTVWPPFLSIVQQTANFFTGVILPTLPAVAAALRTTLGETVQWLARDVWPRLADAATVAWQFISGTIVPALPVVARELRSVLGGAIEWIATDGWPMLLDAGRIVVAWLTGPLVSAVRTAVEWLGPKIQAAASWLIEEGWPTLVDSGRAFASWVTGTAVPTITSLVDWLGPKISTVVNWITQTGWPTLVSAGGAVVSWITGPATAAFTSLVDWLGPKVGDVVNWLIEVGWPTLVMAGEAVVGWITGPATAAFTSLVDWLGPKVGDVVNWLIQVGWPTLVMAGEKVSTWITGVAVPAFEELVAWLGPKVSEVTTWITDTGWPAMVAMGTKVWTMLQEGIKYLQDMWAELEKQKVWDDLNKLWETAHQMGTALINDVLAGNQGMGAQLTHTSTGAAGLVKEFKEIVALAQGVLDFMNGLADGLNKVRDFLDFMGDSSLFEKITGRKIGQAAPEDTLIGPGGRWIDTNTIPLINGLFGPAGTKPGSGQPSPAGAGISGGGNVMNYPSGSWESKAYAAAVKAGHPNPVEFVEQMRWESGNFDPDVISGKRNSSAGAQGIAQIMPQYHPGVNPLDPDAALEYAAGLMTRHYGTYGNSQEALAAYSGGGGAVQRLREGRPYQETQQYLAEVGSRTAAARQSMPAAPANAGTSTYADEWGNQYQFSPEDIKARPGGAAGLTLIGSPMGASTNGPVGNVNLSQTQQAWSQQAKDANAICGPYLASLFTSAVGRPPTPEEARKLGAEMGIYQGGGILNAAGFDEYATAMIQQINPGSTARVTQTHGLGNADASALAAQSLQGGMPIVGFNTQEHYFGADQYDPNTNRFHVGGTGLSLRGGSEWMSVNEMTEKMGPLIGVLQLTGVEAGNTGAQTALMGQQVAGATAQVDGASVSVAGLGTAAAAGAPQLSAVGAALGPMVAQMDEGRVSVAGMTDAIIQQAASQGVGAASAEQYSAGLITQKDALLEVLAGFATTTPAAAELHTQLSTGAITVDQAAIAFAGLATTTATASGEIVTSATTLGTEVPAQFGIMQTGTQAAVDLMATGATASTDLMATDVVAGAELMAKDATAAADTMGTDVVAATDTMGTDAAAAAVAMATDIITEAQRMGTDALTAAQTMNTDVVAEAGSMATGVVDAAGAMVSDFSSSLQDLEEPASTAIETMQSIGEVEIEAPDVGDLIEAMEDVEDAAKDALKAVKDINSAEKGGSKGGNSGLGKKAMGGWTVPNQMTLVGEEGPELISDSRSRYVYTAAETRGMLGGGDIDYDRLARTLASVRPEAHLTQYIDAAPSASEIQRGTQRAFRRIATDWDFS